MNDAGKLERKKTTEGAKAQVYCPNFLPNPFRKRFIRSWIITNKVLPRFQETRRTERGVESGGERQRDLNLSTLFDNRSLNPLISIREGPWKMEKVQDKKCSQVKL